MDAGRIVVSGHNETRILSADGTILLTLPSPTLAAQLPGDELEIAVGTELRSYDAQTGALRASRSLAAEPAGHDCDFYGDPSCAQPVKLTIGDAARGLVAYVIFENIYVTRLRDNATFSIGRGTLARFTDTGLVYADGARIHLIPFDRLPTAG